MTDGASLDSYKFRTDGNGFVRCEGIVSFGESTGTFVLTRTLEGLEYHGPEWGRACVFDSLASQASFALALSFRSAVLDMARYYDGWGNARYYAVVRLSRSVGLSDGVSGFLRWLQEQVDAKDGRRLLDALSLLWSKESEACDVWMATGRYPREWLFFVTSSSKF